MSEIKIIEKKSINEVIPVIADKLVEADLLAMGISEDAVEKNFTQETDYEYYTFTLDDREYVGEWDVTYDEDDISVCTMWWTPKVFKIWMNET